MAQTQPNFVSQMVPYEQILQNQEQDDPGKLYLIKSKDTFILGKLDQLQPDETGSASFPKDHAVSFTLTNPDIKKINDSFDVNEIQNWQVVAVQEIKVPIGLSRAESIFRYKDKPGATAFEIIKSLDTGVDPNPVRSTPAPPPTAMRTTALGGKGNKRKTMKSVRKKRRKTRILQ